MTNKIENLKDLLIEESRELYNTNQQELVELPGIEKTATSAALKKIIQAQMVSSETQQRNLAEVLGKLNTTQMQGKCETTQSILKRSQQRISQSADEEVRDAGIINSLQYLSHRKIAGLGASAAYANQIGRKDAAKIFHKALQEEKKIDAKLSKLAEKEINKKAAKEMVA